MVKYHLKLILRRWQSVSFVRRMDTWKRIAPNRNSLGNKTQIHLDIVIPKLSHFKIDEEWQMTKL